MTYEEALAIDREENAEIWSDYIHRNNLPQTRQIIYNSSYPSGGATIWRVIVQKTASGFPTITYGAQGKIVVDAKSRTFAIGSFGAPFVTTENAIFNIGAYSLSIDNSQYSSLYLSLVCPVEVPVSISGEVGTNSEFLSAGFTVSGGAYWRKTIYNNITERL